MFDENAVIIPGGTNPVKPYETFGSEKWTPREKKIPGSVVTEPEPVNSTAKKEIGKKKELERVSKIQVRKGGNEATKEPKNRELDLGKGKSGKKGLDDTKLCRLKKKEKVEEKVVPENRMKGGKTRALSAFGTTFYKNDSDIPAVSNKRGTSSERFGRAKMSRSKDRGNDDEDGENISETKLNPSRRKLTEDVEDGRVKAKSKGRKSRSVQRICSNSSLLEGKVNDGKKPNKGKAITAFGSTFRKPETDTVPLPRKKTSSFTDRLSRSKSTKLKDVGGVELEDGEGTPKASISKNKLMDMVEESNKDRGKGRGAFSTNTGKRARSPYQTSSEVNANPSKVRVEGDSTREKHQSEERAEIGKEMSFFEKLQQNLRSYFSPRSPEMAKYEEEKKPAQEGENHENDESIMKEERIMRGVKNLIMVAEVEVFEKGSTSLESGDLPGGKSKTERNGSGPGGNFNYTFGDSLDIYYLSTEKRCKKVYYIKRGFECTEKRRPTSFHRSKTLQKNALAEPTPPESSTSVGLTLEPGEQVQNIPSAHGVASAFAQVQEFHQEIARRNGIRAREETPAFVQEEYLTSIVTCLPGESVREKVRRERSRTGIRRPTRNRRSKRCLSRKSSEDLHGTRWKIRWSRSEGAVQRSNVPVGSASDGQQRGDVLQREEMQVAATKKSFKPEKIHLVPRRTRWFVYSLTETTLTESKSIQTPPRETTAATAVESDITTAAIGESDRKEVGKSPIQKPEELSPFTLKDIISLTRRVFREREESRGEAEGGRVAKNADPSLGYYLEKLMDEKRNYLNLQKTKNFRKAQKVNFIADSFNFFNLLNKEFLSVKTSNASIDKLRSVIAENRDSKMEEYLDMYKKVIRTSLTEPEQCLMDKAKVDLERYTDMYYDLMKYICMEKDGKNAGKTKPVCSNPLRSPTSGNTNRINYYEILKQDVRRNASQGNGYLDRIKPRLERPFYVTKIEESRKNRDFNSGRNTYRTSNPRKGNEKEQRLTKTVAGPEKVKQIVELLSPPKTKEATVETKVGKKERTNQGKVLLTISVCNDGLIIKQVTEPAKGDTDTTTESMNSTGVLESSEEDKKKSGEPLPAEDKYSRSRNSVSETNLGASMGTSSDEVEKTQSELLLRTESDATVYPKSSVDEGNESSESPVEHPMLKFRAFRKLLNEGLKYLTSFGESPEADGHDCPKIPKGGKVPETREEPVKYPKTTISVKEPTEKETKKFFDECKPGHQKSTYVRDPRQTSLKDRGSPLRSRANEAQEERMRKLLKRNLPPFSRGVSPCKMSKKESSGEEGSKGRRGASLWWRTDKSSVSNTSPARQRKPYRPAARKTDGNALANRMSLLSKTLKEAESSAPHSKLRGGKKDGDKKRKESAKKEEAYEELDLRESRSEYATPTGSYFEWRFGMNSLKDLLSEMPPSMLNPGGVTVGKLICEEAEEKELHKMDLSCGDETNGDSPPQTLSDETGLRLRYNNPLRTEWDQLLEASFQKDYEKVSKVLNQFVGNISEAWKAALYLKDFIKCKSIKESNKEVATVVTEEVTKNTQGESSQQQNGKNKAIESFRNFLRILTKVFEENQEEAAVRRELFLVMKEVIESSSPTTPVKALLNELAQTGNRTVFYREIAQMPQEVRNMVADSLISMDKTFSRGREDYEPGSFVKAVKDVGEKLKNLYFAGEGEKEADKSEVSGEVEKAKEVEEKVPKPKKIYYRPPKKDLPEKNGYEATVIKSNLQSLAEKIGRIYKDRKPHAEGPTAEKRTAKGEGDPEKSISKKLVRSRSSIYFDAADRFHHSEDGSRVGKSDRMPLNTVDESYFALSGKTFGKYRDLIYDKIIAFLKSDNPYNINYGMALLARLMEKDNGPPTRSVERATIVKEERERKWYDLVDKLMEMCHVIESEMKEQVEKRLAAESEEGADEKELELVRTCEYLKSHVDKMKVLMEEMKEPVRQRGRDSTARVQALEESRQTNMERQLMTSSDLPERPFLNQKYLDNAIAFINSIGMFGCSIDKFSKGFLSNWFAGRKEEQPESVSAEEEEERLAEESDETKDGSVLECNKNTVINLKKSIDRRQKRIREMMDQAEKDGIKREESLTDERLMRKVRDLKKCYNLLEKMICDPTMLPPKWLKLSEDVQDVDGELFKGKVTPETDFHVLTALEGVTPSNAKETRLVRYSHSNASFESKKTVLDQLSIELLALININFSNVDLEFDLPVAAHRHHEDDSLFQRPKTA